VINSPLAVELCVDLKQYSDWPPQSIEIRLEFR
jgi:hypothetical protein